MSKPENTIRILIEARKLIEDEGSWCHGYQSIDGKICAVHALQKARRVLNYHPEEETASYEALAIGMGIPSANGPAMGRWNDDNAHADVLAAYDHAIEWVKQSAVN